MKRVSIKDIASAAGVSTATVSLVLTGKGKDGRVSKEVTEKIKLIAHEMHYQPNRLAMGLQSGRSQTVGLLVADISNPFFGSLAFYIQEEMEKAGYAVIIVNTDESDLQMERMVMLLKSRQVDGLIIVPTEFGNKCIKNLLEEHIPLVLVDRYYPELFTENVLIDNYRASYMATQYLIRQKCQKVALFIYQNNQPHMTDRKNGYKDALIDAHIFDEDLICEVHYRTMKKDIEDAISSLIHRYSDIDGILFATNTIAITGIKQLLNLGIRISEDIHVVCFDKSDAFEFMPVFIPYIHQPIDEIGRLSANCLIKQIENKEIEGEHKLLAELIEKVEDAEVHQAGMSRSATRLNL